jgi:hypothetical protein
MVNDFRLWYKGWLTNAEKLVTKVATVSVSNPKGLSDSEWKSIHGTEMHTKMVQNRLCVDLVASDESKRKMFRIISKWMRENCNSIYYLVDGKNSDPVLVYILADADAVNFKMYFHDHEAPEVPVPAPKPPPPPPPPPSSPAQDILDRIKKRKQWEMDRLEQDRKQAEWEDLFPRGDSDTDKYRRRPPTIRY